MTTNRIGDWIQTYPTGIKFWPLDPRPEEIHIEDIARALSLICRFGGHCKFHYSVAQHSVLVSHKVPPEDALWGLLHDAPEAYLGDQLRPVKRSMEFKLPCHPFVWRFEEADHRLMTFVVERFQLEDMEMPPYVHEADLRMLMTEKRDLLVSSGLVWGEVQGRAEPYGDVCITEIEPSTAERMFLDRFYQLKGATNV